MAYPKHLCTLSITLCALILMLAVKSSETKTLTAKKFLSEAKDKEVFDWMVRIRRRLHEQPELLYDLPKTSQEIQNALRELDIAFVTGVARTGVVGYIGTGEEPFVALRADMDGLPIQESVEWEHKSQIPGQMHACGHDAHVSMLLGAAKILKKHEKDLPGTIVLVFQPAEEGGAGANEVLASGVLSDVKAIFGLHVGPGHGVGFVGGRAGEVMAGSGIFEARITGKGGHAAQPHESIDPVVAAANVILSLQQLVSREANPSDSQVVTVSRLEGSDAFNVIPEFVTIGGSFRAFKPIWDLQQRIREVIISQAAVSRCNATVTFFEDEKPIYPAVINDKDLHVHFNRVAIEMLGADYVVEVPLLTVSEDFSLYQESGLKGYFFFIGVTNATAGRFAVHNSQFDIAEEAFPYGAALHASLAASYLTDVLAFRANHDVLRDEL